MKRVFSFLFVCILGVTLGACNQKSNIEENIILEKNAEANSTMEIHVANEGNNMSEKTIFTKLKEYLPKKVLDNMPNFRKEDYDGSTLYLWSKSGSNSDTFIHKIEFKLNENELKHYHYKSYSFFELDGNKIPKNKAVRMVKNFAKDFIKSGDTLIFVNKQAYDSLYVKDVVESWVAEKDGKEYIIMVNLYYGYVEFATVQEKY